MKTARLAIVAAVILAACSCATPGRITYFSDVAPGAEVLETGSQSSILIQPKDQLSILVNCQNPKLTAMFNLPNTSNQAGAGSSSSQVSGYTVDSEGNIDFPVLGKIHIAGMTSEEISCYVKAKLQSENLIKDPVVTVEFMNLHVSVLGEVSKPGIYDISKDRMTILEALSLAGDLTIFGKRENVKVMREENGRQSVYSVNLCDGKDVYSSPVYYLRQNDVIYVEPNDTRALQSTVNGNVVRSASFWVSCASLLTSLITVVSVVTR